MRFCNGLLKTVIPAVTIPNGIVWPSDSPYFYFIDIYTREIRRYARHNTDESVTAGEQAYSTIVRARNGLSMPDSMYLGSDGHLWVAHWGDFAVCKWHIETGELLDKIGVNVPHVTSFYFGGLTGTAIFISTAREGLSEVQLQRFPDSGKIFHFNNIAAEYDLL